LRHTIRKALALHANPENRPMRKNPENRPLRFSKLNYSTGLEEQVIQYRPHFSKGGTYGQDLAQNARVDAGYDLCARRHFSTRGQFPRAVIVRRASRYPRIPRAVTIPPFSLFKNPENRPLGF